MLKQLNEMLDKLICRDLALERIDQIELALRNDPNYEECFKETLSLLKTIKDKLPKEDHKLVLDYECQESNITAELLERTYRQGLNDGLNFNKSLSDVLIYKNT